MKNNETPVLLRVYKFIKKIYFAKIISPFDSMFSESRKIMLLVFFFTPKLVHNVLNLKTFLMHILRKLYLHFAFKIKEFHSILLSGRTFFNLKHLISV